MTEVNEAAERVRLFLLARSAMPNQDPEAIYAIGTRDGVIELSVSDLVTLVRGVLGDVPVRTRAHRVGLVIDYDEALRREAVAGLEGESDA